MTRKIGDSPPTEPSSADRTSGPSRGSRRSVEPYRDARDALVARRRALARELEEAERAASRRDGLALRLALADDALRTRSAPLIDEVTIATPCKARWEDMSGSDAVRRCERCRRDVHDLSKMTEAEIEALLGRAGETPCVRLRRRPDGRVVTASCPAPTPNRLVRAAGLVTASLLAGTAAGVAATAAVAPTPVAVAPMPARAPEPSRAAPPIRAAALRSTPEPEPQDGFEMGEPVAFEPAPASPSTPLSARDLDRHIRWIAPQAWEIDRALVDRSLASRQVLQRSSRLIPHEENGRVVGVRVYGIRRASILGRLGLQNGDMLIDVNGYDLAAPDRALEAYARLRQSNALFVRLRRRGEERLHVYRIVH